MKVIEKLFIVRTLLGLSQREAGDQAQINQAVISLLERGEKKFIPSEYLRFLHNKGIDLNWLFDENNNTIEIFRPGIPESLRPTIANVPENSLPSFIVKGMDKEGNAITTKKEDTASAQTTTAFREILDELKKLNQNLEKQFHTGS